MGEVTRYRGEGKACEKFVGTVAVVCRDGAKLSGSVSLLPFREAMGMCVKASRPECFRNIYHSHFVFCNSEADNCKLPATAPAIILH